MNYPNTSDRIDTWIAKRYDALRQRVMDSCFFNEDVFQDTYLALRDLGAETGKEEAEFIRLYKVMLSRNCHDEWRNVNPDPLFFDLLSEDVPEPVVEASDPLAQAQQVERIGKAILNEEDYTLFRLRFKVGLTLHEIAAYIGRKATAVFNKLKQIAERIRAYFRPVLQPVTITI